MLDEREGRVKDSSSICVQSSSEGRVSFTEIWNQVSGIDQKFCEGHVKFKKYIRHVCEGGSPKFKEESCIDVSLRVLRVEACRWCSNT